MHIKIENWNGHEIRFVWHNEEWWAVAKDVADALGYSDAEAMTRKLDSDEKTLLKHQNLFSVGFEIPNRGMIIISEYGIYETVFGSEKLEAKEFKRWVKQILKTLRQSIGLEGFQIFRLLDKEHQKAAMHRLHEQFPDVDRWDYMDANMIANDVMARKHGLRRALKKGEMPPEWLPERQQVLDETVDLMIMNKKYNLHVGVPCVIYRRFGVR